MTRQQAFELEGEAGSLFAAAEILECAMPSASGNARTWATFQLLDEIKAFRAKFDRALHGDAEPSLTA